MRCPAARSVLASAVQLEMPRIGIIGLEDDSILVTADGVRYRLNAEAAYPGQSLYDIEINSNLNTPLARWVDQSLLTLEPCWSRERTRR